MSIERAKGIQVHRPIIYGSHARLLSEAEKQLSPPGHTHRWTIFLTSAATPPPQPTDPPNGDDMDYILGGADDMSYFIKRVTFRLHETYANPSRVLDKPPYQVTETGWGEFTVQIKVQFISESGEKPLNLAHPIKLHHWGPPIEPLYPPLALPSGPTDSTPKPTASADVQMESSPAVNLTSTPAVENNEVKEELQTPKPQEDASIPPATPLPTADPVQPSPISVAARYPVHAWQYDEIVFTDPPLVFLNILDANLPTPLPPKNRRPKDQREVHELKSGKKNQKNRPVLSAASRGQSRTGEQTPQAATGNVAASVGTPGQGVGTPGGVPPPGAMTVGIPGESGSADVPLEFSVEMEKAEYNRLNDARIELVSQQDRWREKLIALEKETARLKEEMGIV
ncbi:hypothetical protein TREMEDRAFT_66697 [Tremella mesenterica DSM 1558]|uniref:uncharacterized protein n=1 Tax=Tremella mesenterica (strain ATCC 24925 / CBS 8224 / DSM 1558 / NBRC 9311 / NRRL Y-6157 / RJB 2259-6 / UBC 559-6) TaxID=578456 RepID=UPI0003F49469|nr:uncharacterized protein TREMEDRAFT_66697 [Tremella mesenterica DSM 1558]EIW72072.1 hypothetical protein TREMEDRAFT_66697 [Tremella mesenterica DSM 1558]